MQQPRCPGSLQVPTHLIGFPTPDVHPVQGEINRNATHLCPAGCGSQRYPRTDGTFPNHKPRRTARPGRL